MEYAGDFFEDRLGKEENEPALPPGVIDSGGEPARLGCCPS
jgi:hypothetical protein